ncbi:MAG: hypothetical protein K8953_05050, partial [Proteobacteria bacterium]|nr:hypothetical protein [Pseudomonadota bacterium]
MINTEMMHHIGAPNITDSNLEIGQVVPITIVVRIPKENQIHMQAIAKVHAHSKLGKVLEIKSHPEATMPTEDAKDDT